MHPIQALLHQELIAQSGHIPAQDIPFSSAVRFACSQNACGQYGRNWTCPPGVGEQEALAARLAGYKTAWVFTHVQQLEDSFDIEGMDAGRQASMALLRSICEQLTNAKIAHLPLGAGACRLCETCSYPAQPCRFPARAIVSMEACGIDVTALAKLCNIRYYSGANTVTNFMMILEA